MSRKDFKITEKKTSSGLTARPLVFFMYNSQFGKINLALYHFLYQKNLISRA